MGKWLEVIQAERKRQDRKWGQQNHDDGRWALILAEEVGEAAQSALQGAEACLMEELVQVAAVAVAWLEAIERRTVEA